MRLGGLKLPVEQFSATSLAKAIDCPESWRRRYLSKEKEGFAVERFVGSVFHKTIEGAYKDKLEGHLWTDELLDSAHVYCWHDQLDREDGWSFGTNDPEKLIERGAKMVHAYFDEFFHQVNPIAVESRYEETIPGLSVPLMGYIDVETSNSILDLKTAPNKLSKPKPTWTFQGRIYQLFAPKTVEFQVTTKQVTPQVTSLVMPRANPDRTVSLIQEVVYRLNDLYERLGSDVPWPTTGLLHPFLCDYCHYRKDCVAHDPPTS